MPRRAGRAFGPLLLACVGIGCASKAPPPVAKPATPSQPARLAWMPLDPFDVPAVARAVNDELSRVKLAGGGAGTKAAVSMEVAQLAIECIQPTPACYRAVGHSLGADRLMWAQIDPAEEKIRVSVMYFDVRAGTTSTKVGTFDGVDAARAGVAELVGHAADSGSRSP
ncbi:MAG TPA: hypothetical protein VN903_21695 [Polyangia bacterium]|nr:hypothetical protein [Polyangia bacterium]